MLTQNLGYPRIGANRELKKACEQFWAGKISETELLKAGRLERQKNWQTQMDAGIDLIPCNDFSFYDQVQDMSFTLGVVPDRFRTLKQELSPLELYFAMCRGYQKNGEDALAMEMTKWFDTNYHYIVPEFVKGRKFSLQSSKILGEYIEAKNYGVRNPKPVLIGPLTYLLLGKERDADFNRLDLLPEILPVYKEIIAQLVKAGCEYIQLDEPCLVTDLSPAVMKLYQETYGKLRSIFPELHIILATYFDTLGNNQEAVLNLPVNTLHIEVVRGSSQINDILNRIPACLNLSLGVVDGRNVWKNNMQQSLNILKKALYRLGSNRLMIAPSCSLLHVPYDLEAETRMPGEIRRWLAFAQQKCTELVTLRDLLADTVTSKTEAKLLINEEDIITRRTSRLVKNDEVKKATENIFGRHFSRKSEFERRKVLQQAHLDLPLYPTTTIGSFPQTAEVRKARRAYKKGQLGEYEYKEFLREETQKAIRWQEETGIDVLVHGEFERNDMVEYFGEQLDGFVFTENGWVQSYGSRGVKPPIIYGDVSRKAPMTVEWTKYAQSLTHKKVKGMLTGPVTILQWSFVRDDQPRSITAFQIALALNQEVLDLEKAGISVIQIDEPALREGLPLKTSEHEEYLDWAVKAFRICAAQVLDETQIHTHMCYAEFNHIINAIADMDADVISIETSRSHMELLKVFEEFHYPNQIGPGVYDIHSPRIPTEEEMTALIREAAKYVSVSNLWVNPDCGLKTRRWEEVKPALENMVRAAAHLRETVKAIL